MLRSQAGLLLKTNEVCLVEYQCDQTSWLPKAYNLFSLLDPAKAKVIAETAVQRQQRKPSICTNHGIGSRWLQH